MLFQKVITRDYVTVYRKLSGTICYNDIPTITLLSWLQKFFTGRTQFTKIGAVLSHITDVISGVIQGSVLGPLMFLTFVNELAELLANCGIIVKFFADDVKLYARIINDVDVDTLQAAVDALCRWLRPGNYRSLLTSVVSCMLVSLRPMFPSLLAA